MAALALGGLAYLIGRIGPDVVLGALGRSANLLPVVLLLEAGIAALETVALRALYGADAHRIPTRVLVRACLTGYPVMCLVPVGRAAAEAARAVVLAPYTSAGIAAAVATRLQGVLSLGNGLVCVMTAAAVVAAAGPPALAWALAGNSAVMFVIGAAVLALGAFARLGRGLARITQRAERFGAAFDGALRAAPPLPVAPLAAAVAARLVQVTQYGVLVVAVGGAGGVSSALIAEGIHMLGASAGDLIPSQLGATEATFALSAPALGFAAADAVAIAILGRFAQLFWAAVGVVAAALERPPPAAGG